MASVSVALDTNVLVRLFVAPADAAESRQQQEAATLLRGERRFLVTLSVALELGWVLGSVYRHPAAQLQKVFEHLAALSNVAVERAPDLLRAAQGNVAGLDFADALHLACSDECAQMATFDRSVVRKTARLNGPVRAVLPAALLA